VLRDAQCTGGDSCGPLPVSFFRTATTALFLTANALWKTDGTSAGTVQLGAMPNASLVARGDRAAYILSNGTLWKTDGTAAGTKAVGALRSTAPRGAPAKAPAPSPIRPPSAAP
jgi:hypothetical protein